jgi:hypothetical protein
LPILKGKSKIKEGEHLSSLERAKEVSIKKRHSICQKSIAEKKIPSYKHCLLVSMIKPLMISLSIIIVTRKTRVKIQKSPLM